jgi:hypothetical protein
MAHRERKRPDIAGLFDEKDGPARRDRPGGDAARLEALAALEMSDAEATELDAGRAAAYLDDALTAEDRAAFEAELARSADLREQLAGFAAARAAATDGDAAMPAELAADFDAVPAPAGGPDRKAEAVPAKKASWLAALVPSRRWAYAMVPALLVAVVLAVIGPQLYRDARGPGPSPAPSEPAPTASTGAATAAKSKAERARRETVGRLAKEARRKTETERREAKHETGAGRAGRSFARRDLTKPALPAAKTARPREAAPPPKVAEKDALKRAPAKPGPATPGAGPALAETVVPVTAELRAALIALAAQQTKPAAQPRASGAVGGLAAGAKRDAERKAKEEEPAALADTDKRYMAVLDRALGACPGGEGTCCRPRTIDPALVKALRAGGKGPAEIQVTYYAGGACRLSLPASSLR